MRKITLTILLAGVFISAHAQQKTIWSFHVGGLMSTYTGSHADNYKPGLYFGGGTEVKLSGRFFFQPELSMSVESYPPQTGCDVYGGPLIKFHLPVLFRYYPVKRFSVDVGPQFSVNTNGDSSVTLGDISIISGISFRANSKLDLNFRFYYGFYDNNFDRLLNRNIGFRLGVTFRFLKK